MKKILLIAILCLISGCSVHVDPTISQEELNAITERVNKSKIVLLDIYSDGCHTCKVIDPTVHKLEEKHAFNPDVVVLKHDYSSPLSTANSNAIASAIGVYEVANSQRYYGVVLIINSKTKEVLDTLIGEKSIEAYDAAIQKNLKKVSQ